MANPLRVGALGGIVFGIAFALVMFIPIQDFPPALAAGVAVVLGILYGAGGALLLLFGKVIYRGRKRLVGDAEAAPRRFAVDGGIAILAVLLVYELWRTQNVWMFLGYLTTCVVAGYLANALWIRLAARRRPFAAGVMIPALILIAAGGGAAAVPAPLPTVDTNLPEPNRDVRLMVFGLDGFDWKLLDPLIEKGAVPTLARLAEEGAAGTLMSNPPLISPRIWTTLATGKDSDKHGVNDFLVDLLPPDYTRPVLLPKWPFGLDYVERVLLRTGILKRHAVTSTLRRTKAVWNMLSAAGVSSGVVGWWGTWPAEEVNGFIVSDFADSAARESFMNFMQKRDYVSEMDHSVARLTYPEPLLEEIKPFKTSPSDLSPDLIREFLHVDDEEIEQVRAIRTMDNFDPFSNFVWVLAQDEFHSKAGLHLYDLLQPDFFSVYLEGPDVLGHHFWKWRFPEEFEDVAEEDVQKYGHAIDQDYIYADRVIARFLEKADERTWVLIVSDHGMKTFPPELRAKQPWGAGHRRQGTYILWSPSRSLADDCVTEPTVLDITPTILYLFGLPIGEDMDGKPWTECVSTTRLASGGEPATIRTWDEQADRRHDIVPSAISDEKIEKLKALGYIE